MAVPIMYVGKKLLKKDNVAGTGAVWNGAGDVQLVSEEAAIKLLANPLVWQRAVTERQAGPGLSAPPQDKFDEMDKDALYGYAAESLNLILDRRRPLNALRDQVRKASELKSKKEEEPPPT